MIVDKHFGFLRVVASASSWHAYSCWHWLLQHEELLCSSINLFAWFVFRQISSDLNYPNSNLDQFGSVWISVLYSCVSYSSYSFCFLKFRFDAKASSRGAEGFTATAIIWHHTAWNGSLLRQRVTRDSEGQCCSAYKESMAWCLAAPSMMLGQKLQQEGALAWICHRQCGFEIF